MEVKDIVAAVGQYKTKDGAEKTDWITIGKLFIKDGGRMSLILKAVPTGWDGSAIVSDRKAAAKADGVNNNGGDLPF